ncbi:MAG: transposase [Planctomycetaceae bacterium]|nr:transposase [Planctomycetaceae bacterium]
MSATTRTQRTYDHRLRDLIRSTGDIRQATGRGVPRSTARGWLTSSRAEVVTVDGVDRDIVTLQMDLLALRRLERLIALLRLVILLWKFSGFSLTNLRIPDRARKLRLLRAIDRSHSALPLRSVLRVLRLSHSRFHAWKQEKECGLDDVPSCPRTSPQQLTAAECKTIEEMVMSDAFRHVPTGTLARLAQRLGKVFASPTTWYRLVRQYRWRRPRKRLHPARPKIGIRAACPNEIWHVDTTLIRLLDGDRAYLHAVIDNFSRRILAWKVSVTFDPSTTAELLLSASIGLVGQKPTLLADGGVENFNGSVDKLVESGLLRRLLAQTEITHSNSLIESWWRVLKHQWLYLNTLDTVTTLGKLIAFYVSEHNARLPHSAFRGQTPDEMYHGTGNHIPKELELTRKAARQARMDANRKRTCPRCDPLVPLSP